MLKVLHKIITHEGVQAVALTVGLGLLAIGIMVIPLQYAGPLCFGIVVTFIAAMMAYSRKGRR